MKADAATQAGAPQHGTARRPPRRTHFGMIGAVSFVHMLNDMMQSVIVTIYPLLKHEFALSFIQIGLITMTFQVTASILQPVVGMVTDKKPLPYSLPLGMFFTLAGLLLISVAPTYPILLLAVALIGCGSSVSIPNPPASPAWLLADVTASRNRCSRSAAIPARRWGRCLRQ